MRKLASNFLFYPAATIYAIFAVPASVFSMLGIIAPIPGLATPAQHAHEMLFGFALGVVMGNQGGAVSAQRLMFAFALWLIARASCLVAPQSLPSLVANIAFAALLAWTLVPRLFRAVKRLRNFTLPVALTAICVSAIAIQIAAHVDLAAAQPRSFAIALLLFALLILFMGGRIIAPAVAGQFYKQGLALDTRVQPGIEGASVLCVGSAVVLLLIAQSPVAIEAMTLASIAMIAAGALCAVRLARWRLWVLRGRPDLLCLAAGYAWLALGLMLLGAAGFNVLVPTAAMHAIAIGSLGTLTLNVMAMAWVLKARMDPSRAGFQVVATLFLSAAAVARILAGQGVGDPRALLVFAAVCWSAAFASLLVLFVRVRVVVGRRESSH